jgi:hypothetical protein
LSDRWHVRRSPLASGKRGLMWDQDCFAIRAGRCAVWFAFPLAALASCSGPDFTGATQSQSDAGAADGGSEDLAPIICTGCADPAATTEAGDDSAIEAGADVLEEPPPRRRAEIRPWRPVAPTRATRVHPNRAAWTEAHATRARRRCAAEHVSTRGATRATAKDAACRARVARSASSRSAHAVAERWNAEGSVQRAALLRRAG